MFVSVIRARGPGDEIRRKPPMDKMPEGLEKGAVVDASALIGGMPYSGSIRLHIPPLVEDEVKGLEGVDLLLAAQLEVSGPSPGNVERVRKAATETGDDARLSEADIEVLALALELELPILTDDYSIQNLAKHMGLRYIPVGERGITRKIEWTYRCKGCGRYFEEKLPVCPICGSDIRSSRPPGKRRREKKAI
jgi:UPF0271 protein